MSKYEMESFEFYLFFFVQMVSIILVGFVNADSIRDVDSNLNETNRMVDSILLSVNELQYNAYEHGVIMANLTEVNRLLYNAGAMITTQRDQIRALNETLTEIRDAQIDIRMSQFTSQGSISKEGMENGIDGVYSAETGWYAVQTFDQAEGNVEDTVAHESAHAYVVNDYEHFCTVTE